MNRTVPGLGLNLDFTLFCLPFVDFFFYVGLMNNRYEVVPVKKFGKKYEYHSKGPKLVTRRFEVKWMNERVSGLRYSFVNRRTGRGMGRVIWIMYIG